MPHPTYLFNQTTRNYIFACAVLIEKVGAKLLSFRKISSAVTLKLIEKEMEKPSATGI